MVTIKNTNDIVLDLIDYFKVSQPNLDTKIGSIARDISIDSVASVLSLLYDQLGSISNLQSLRVVSGSDLDRLAQNYGSTRKTAVASSGTALLTFASIPATIAVNAGSIITASSGATFSITNPLSINPAQANTYKSIAIKYQANLSFLNITDPYAVEITVQATTPGSAGNISQYALTKTTIQGVSNVTNVFPFTGGSDQENDTTFRNRVLAIFSGSNIGTSLGYKNLALSNSAVLDAVVIGPGNPLMTRDGTIVSNSTGTPIIISEGTGGKVDILILGNVLTSFTDTFIYQDQSNNNDPTAAVNNVVLGQIPADANLTVTQKRVVDIANGVLPAQPVQEILQVTGTSSGANFLPKSTDAAGVVSGNYELIKDTGVYAGSPWAFDTFHWISNQITNFNDNRIKGQFNGQDITTFTDVLQIPNATQNISITNENSLVSSSDNSMIQLLHVPATNVTQVFNTNTGEQYTIINQNVDGTGLINTTGIIQISGNTLPSTSDILQVNYTWFYSYDCFSDYDGKILKNNPRNNGDSVDWGIANAVRSERILFSENVGNTVFTGITTLPISYVISANEFSSTIGTIVQSIVPNFTTRLAINLFNLLNPINTIEHIFLTNSNIEIYNTAASNGFIINNSIVVNNVVLYNSTIVLPSDTVGIIGNISTITYNQQDTFNIANSSGSFVLNSVTIPSSNVTVSTSNIYLDVTYIAANQNLFSVGIANFPISRSGNGYIINDSNGSLNSIPSNTIKRENQTIQLNSINQTYINLSIDQSDYTLDTIVSVIDLASGKEIWNQDFPGTITTNINGNYQLIFSGFNSPIPGDNVLAIYFASDLIRFQPFTYNNNIIKLNFQNLLFDFSTNNFFVPIQNFIPENNIAFDIIDDTTGNILLSGTDGYISSVANNASIATFSALTETFSSINDLTGKSIRLINTVNPNNKGIFNILSIINPDTITIGVVFSNLLINQISIIRLADNIDLWSANLSSSIDIVNNRLNLPQNILASQNDAVVAILFTNKNISQAQTRLAVTVSDQVQNTGIITFSGTTITKVANIVFTAIENGLRQNALSAFKTFLNLTTNASISQNTYLTRLVSLQKVSTTGTEILSTLATYDVEGTYVINNTFYANEMLLNETLQNTEFVLPSTENNISNAPQIGDQLYITFYYATKNNSENLYFTKNGTLYTNNKFISIDNAYISSGFNSSQTTRFSVIPFTQPITGSRYTSIYNYLAPKQNERILINYDYNSLISTTTFTVEASRPLNADVLVKAASEVLVDATVNILISSTATTSAVIILQNVQTAITAAINTNTLGATLSSSTLIVAAQSVNGVARSRVLYFNIDGVAGQVLTLTAQQNQYFVANTITINQDSS